MTRAMLDHPDYRQAMIGSLQKGNAGTVAEYKRLTLVEMGIKGAVPAYGLTETYGNATVGSPDDPLEVTLATSGTRSEETKYELQSLMRISYAGCCLEKTKRAVKAQLRKTSRQHAHDSEHTRTKAY